MTIEAALDDLEMEFQEAPLNFTVESALQARLLTLLRWQVGEQITVRGGYDEANVTNYKRKYVDRIAEPQSISNVQAEVNFGGPGNNRSLDIAILNLTDGSEFGDFDYLPDVAEPNVTVKLVDGSKYFSPSSINHATEIKFIKNVDIAGSRLEREDIEEWPYFTNDLQKLGDLPEAESRHLVVTNKNPFQQEETDGRSTDTARRRYRRVAEECAKRGITLTAFHPKERGR